jgi:lipopolysaccharide transport system ATP-binding protein
MYAIKVENLSKRFQVGRTAIVNRSLTDMVKGGVRSTWNKLRSLTSPGNVPEDQIFWALRDVSFDVKRGEVVGILGSNGAGKSTLLKLLSRISAPSEGRIEMRGRLGSLLEVGTGFHPELTGRENVFLSGSILGMSRAEIHRKFDQIAEFSEVEQFLDTPVKRYSSGMYVRLAFSVAAHLNPDILIVDEVLAVGDTAYQRKCIDRMTELAREGRTILFVSHNMQLIPRLCQRAVYLERGQVRMVGEAGTVTDHYLERMAETTRNSDLKDKPRTGDGRARFVKAQVLDNQGRVLSKFTSFDDLIVRVEIEASKPVEDVDLAIVVQNLSGFRVLTGWNKEVHFKADLKPGLQTFECRLSQVPLRPGHPITIGLWCAKIQSIDWVENALILDVLSDERTQYLSPDPNQSLFVCPHEWRQIS